MNALQTVAERLRTGFAAALDDVRADPPNDNGAAARALDWKVSVCRGLVDDLADFTDAGSAVAFIERRRARLAADGMRHGAAACVAVLTALRNQAE